MAPANVAFVIIGWLYGEGDFGRSVCIATSCGDDTDCTAATLGAIMGIILGRDGIPDEWAEPLGDRIVTIAIDRGSYRHWPETLTELTEQVMEQITPTLVGYRCPVVVSHAPTDLCGVGDLKLMDQSVARTIWARSSYAVVYDFVHSRVTLDYCGDPEIKAGEPLTLKVILENRMPDHRHVDLIWHLPDEWKVSPSRKSHAALLQSTTATTCEMSFEILADCVCEPRYRGILEIIAQGRPTVGLVPLLFLNPASVKFEMHPRLVDTG